MTIDDFVKTKVIIVYNSPEEGNWDATIISYSDIGVTAEAFDFQCFIPWTSIREIRKKVTASNNDKETKKAEP